MVELILWLVLLAFVFGALVLFPLAVLIGKALRKRFEDHPDDERFYNEW